MEQSDIEVLVSELETRLDRLRALYDQYFSGLEKLEPSVPRKDVERRFDVLRREQIRNTALRFRFQMLVQKYNTYQSYWLRVSRQIEQGTYKRDVERAKAKFGVDEKGRDVGTGTAAMNRRAHGRKSARGREEKDSAPPSSPSWDLDMNDMYDDVNPMPDSSDPFSDFDRLMAPGIAPAKAAAPEPARPAPRAIPSIPVASSTPSTPVKAGRVRIVPAGQSSAPSVAPAAPVDPKAPPKRVFIRPNAGEGEGATRTIPPVGAVPPPAIRGPVARPAPAPVRPDTGAAAPQPKVPAPTPVRPAVPVRPPIPATPPAAPPSSPSVPSSQTSPSSPRTPIRVTPAAPPSSSSGAAPSRPLIRPIGPPKPPPPGVKKND